MEYLTEKIVQIGNKWQVQSEKGRNMGTYDTKAEAEKRLQQVHYFKHKNEDLELDVIDSGVPSLHSKKDDRYGHHNYRIEDPDLKRRLAEANPHLAKFLDDHYVWYLIAWAKGIEDGTTYQGFLNIYDDDTKWKKVHGSYSDGYRPEPDLVKDIVFNSIEEDLDIDILDTTLEPGKIVRDGDSDYYVLSQEQAARFFPEYIDYAEAHFGGEEVEFLKDAYADWTNNNDVILDVNLIQDGSFIYIIVWDDYGDNMEECVPIDHYKELGWEELTAVENIPMFSYIYDEDLELNVIEPEKPEFERAAGSIEIYTVHDINLIRLIVDKMEELAPKDTKIAVQGLKELIDGFNPDRNNTIKIYVEYSKDGLGYDISINGIVNDVLHISPRLYPYITEDLFPLALAIDELCGFNYAEAWKEDNITEELDIETTDKFTKLDKQDVKHISVEDGEEVVDVIGERAIITGARKDLLYSLLADIGDITVLEPFFNNPNKYDVELTKYASSGNSYLNFRDKDTGRYDFKAGFGLFGLFIPAEIYDAVTEDIVENLQTEDLDIEVINVPDDSWKKYHTQEDIDYTLPLWEVEELITRDFAENCWWLALYVKKDLMWYEGYLNDIPDESLNGFMSFTEAYKKFLDKKLDEGDRIVLCYHQSEGYGRDEETGEEGLLWGSEDYSMLARGSMDYQDDYSLFEDLDLDTHQGYKYTLHLRQDVDDDYAFIIVKDRETQQRIKDILIDKLGERAYRNEFYDHLPGCIWIRYGYIRVYSDDGTGYITLTNHFSPTESTEILDQILVEVLSEEDYNRVINLNTYKDALGIQEDLDLDVIPDKYNFDPTHLLLQADEDIIYEHGEDSTWYIYAIAENGYIRNGALHELEMGNGEGTFEEMYNAFENYEFQDDEEKLYLAWYDDSDETDAVHEIMLRYNENFNMDEDLDIETADSDSLMASCMTRLNSDDEVLDKLPNYNIYILPDGTFGYVPDNIEMGSQLETDLFEEIDRECITMWSVGRDGSITHIYVQVPDNPLTKQQVDFLLRNRAWLWDSRIPEDSDEFTGTSEYEYYDDSIGWYGITIQNSNAATVDDFLTIHGYANITEDVDLDVVDPKPELIAQYENKDRYHVESSQITQIADIIKDVYGESSGRYFGADVMVNSAQKGDEVILVVWHTEGSGAILSYELRTKGLIFEVCTVRWDGNLDEMAIARDIDAAFGFNYLTEYENKYLNEDLDLDVVKPKRSPAGIRFEARPRDDFMHKPLGRFWYKQYPKFICPSNGVQITKKDFNEGKYLLVKAAEKVVEKFFKENPRKQFCVLLAYDRNNKPVDTKYVFGDKIAEDLELDVLSPEAKLIKNSPRFKQYKISMATVYALRDLKADIYGEEYLWEGGSYLDNLIQRIEEGDEDLQGDIFLDAFYEDGSREYRLEFGTYCVCTLTQFSNIEFEGNLSLEYAKAIEELLHLPSMTKDVTLIPADELLNDLLNLDDEEVDEGLDIEIADHTPTIKMVANEDNPELAKDIIGIVSLGDQAKDYILEHLEELIDTDGWLVDEIKVLEQELEDRYLEFWVYGSQDMIQGGRFSSLRGHLVIKGLNFVLNKHQIPQFESFINSIAERKAVQDANPNDSTNEGLDIEVLDSKQIDEYNRDIIAKFLTDMGEDVVVMNNTIFEGNPSGVRVNGEYRPCRDSAYKCEGGVIHVYYPDTVDNNSEETAVWEKIWNKELSEEEALKTFFESKVMSLEEVGRMFSELWGYSEDEWQREFLN